MSHTTCNKKNSLQFNFETTMYKKKPFLIRSSIKIKVFTNLRNIIVI